MKKIILILALFLSASWAQNLEINPDTGLIIDPDSPLVEANCLACHGPISLPTCMQVEKLG